MKKDIARREFLKLKFDGYSYAACQEELFRRHSLRQAPYALTTVEALQSRRLGSTWKEYIAMFGTSELSRVVPSKLRHER